MSEHASEQERRVPVIASHSGGAVDPSGDERGPKGIPDISDHELIRRIGGGSYGQVWLARNVMGTYRAVKYVFRSSFESDRPFEREFRGIQKFEPISRSHDSQVDILQVGRNEDWFYYVMELADDQSTGSAIHPECYSPRTLRSELDRRGRLSPTECIEIGLSLTQALSHLHMNGLVHRDVKPSNVIFINGTPKLADIGLVSEIEATVSFVGTPGYIPPEGPGTAQADIYSLGKLLYEISTGKDRQDFPEPLTQLGELTEHEGLFELSAVIHKACARNPRDRYTSAEVMHADLLLLKTGKSVRQTHQLERRLAITRRILIAATAIIVFGAVPYYWVIKEARTATEEARKEAENRKRAELAEIKARTSAVKSQQVAEFLKQMLQSVAPRVALGRDTTLVKEILNNTAERVGKDLTDQPEVQAELMTILGDTYNTLGDFEKGETMHRGALAIREKIFGEESLESAESMLKLGETISDISYWSVDRLAEAELLIQKSLIIQKKLSGTEQLGLAKPLILLADVYRRERKHLDQASAMAGEAIRLQQKFLGTNDPQLLLSLSIQSKVFQEQHRMTEAEATVREAISMAGRISCPVEAIDCMQTLALLLKGESRLKEAEMMARQALQASEQLYGPESQRTAVALYKVAEILDPEGNLAEAETLYRAGLTIAAKVPKSESVEGFRAETLHRLADICGKQGRLDEAETLLREGLDIQRNINPDNPQKWQSYTSDLRDVLARQGKQAEIRQLAAQFPTTLSPASTNQASQLRAPVNLPPVF